MCVIRVRAQTHSNNWLSPARSDMNQGQRTNLEQQWPIFPSLQFNPRVRRCRREGGGNKGHGQVPPKHHARAQKHANQPCPPNKGVEQMKNRTKSTVQP